MRPVQSLGALPAAFRPQATLSLCSDAGERGSALLRAHGLDPQDPASFLLLDAQGAWTDTDAILRVLAGLGGAWRLSGVMRMVPRRWRDAAYRALARNRYRWFGRHDACHLPAPEQAARFLD